MIASGTPSVADTFGGLGRCNFCRKARRHAVGCLGGLVRRSRHPMGEHGGFCQDLHATSAAVGNVRTVQKLCGGAQGRNALFKFSIYARVGMLLKVPTWVVSAMESFVLCLGLYGEAIGRGDPMRGLALIFGISKRRCCGSMGVGGASAGGVVRSTGGRMTARRDAARSDSAIRTRLPSGVSFSPRGIGSFRSISNSVTSQFGARIFGTVGAIGLSARGRVVGIALFGSIRSVSRSGGIAITERLKGEMVNLCHNATGPSSSNTSLPIRMICRSNGIFKSSATGRTLAVGLTG